MTRTIEFLPRTKDVRMLDGSRLSAQLWMVRGILATRGASCAQEELTRSARCVAKVVLEALPRLMKTVRTPRRRATPSLPAVLVNEDAMSAWTSGSLKHAWHYTESCIALQSAL